jgi:hypothetical protein
MIDARLNCFGFFSRRPIVGTVVLAGVLGGCAGTDKGTAAKVSTPTHDEGVTHESCSGGHVDALDTNGDGKPDIQRVLDSSGRELCRVVDLNHDGRPDLYEYFDATGAVRRREFCYDDTGAVNAIESYEGGKLAKREYDISGQHRIDTWDWFDPNAPVDAKTGRPEHPVRRERDTTGDGQVDQWWTWNGDKVTIAVDRTGDGKPDPEATIVLGGSPGGSSAASGSGGQDAEAPSASGTDGGTP